MQCDIADMLLPNGRHALLKRTEQWLDFHIREGGGRLGTGVDLADAIADSRKEVAGHSNKWRTDWSVQLGS